MNKSTKQSKAKSTKKKQKTPFHEKNNDKSRQASKEGEAAHVTAEKRLKGDGYVIPRETSVEEDKQGKDFLIQDSEASSGVLNHFFEKYGETISFDAKSAKRKIPKGKKRSNTQPSDTWTSLELENVYGGKGWLRKGKANLIIFVSRTGRIIIADRQELLEWLINESPAKKDIEKLHNSKDWSELKSGEDYVEHSSEAEYKLYTRRFKPFFNPDGSRKRDLIVYVKYEDMEALPSTVVLEEKA